MKKVLITGSTSGIGKITAETLENKGYKVFKTGRKILPDKDFFPCDLSEIANVKFLYDFVKNNFGDIDILINNAGEYHYCPIDSMPVCKIQEMMNVNFTSHYYLTSLISKDMKKNNFGRIINISSISGVVGESHASLYAACKSAYSGFTKSLALELAQYNITVNSISPGWVETPLTENALNEEEKKETLDIIPQKRFVEPVEIADLISYLITQKAKGITGQNINLCAGLSCGC